MNQNAVTSKAQTNPNSMLSPTTAKQSSEDVGELDQIIAEEGIFKRTASNVSTLRRQLIGDALAWHLKNNSPYGQYAARRNFDAAELDELDGLDRVPVFPSAILKRPGVSVVHPTITDFLWTTSSGTKGSVSRIPRDDLTLRRFFAAVGNLSNEMLKIENTSIRVFNLGPNVAEAHDLWISYVMAGVTVMLPDSRNYVVGGNFRIADVIHDLRAAHGQRVVVIGPPPLLVELALAIGHGQASLALDPQSLVVAIGGWKRRSGERVARQEFDELIAKTFGVHPAGVRDTFNMVELNTVMIECENKNLHIPPWLYVRAREPASLAVVASGAPGVLSYLDPTALSYPAFILSDDLGLVIENVACPCGRQSDVLHVERRLNTVESRGCALKMDGSFSVPGAPRCA